MLHLLPKTGQKIHYFQSALSHCPLLQKQDCARASMAAGAIPQPSG